MRIKKTRNRRLVIIKFLFLLATLPYLTLAAEMLIDISLSKVLPLSILQKGYLSNFQADAITLNASATIQLKQIPIFIFFSICVALTAAIFLLRQVSFLRGIASNPRLNIGTSKQPFELGWLFFGLSLMNAAYLADFWLFNSFKLVTVDFSIYKNIFSAINKNSAFTQNTFIAIEYISFVLLLLLNAFITLLVFCSLYNSDRTPPLWDAKELILKMYRSFWLGSLLVTAYVYCWTLRLNLAADVVSEDSLRKDILIQATNAKAVFTFALLSPLLLPILIFLALALLHQANNRLRTEVANWRVLNLLAAVFPMVFGFAFR